LGTELHTWIQDLQSCGELCAEHRGIDVARGSTPSHVRAKAAEFWLVSKKG